jgi:hypothetical protein
MRLENQMGKMNINVDAKVGGKTFGFAFNWEGDADAIESLMRFVEKMAADWKVTPDALTQSILRDLPATGLLKDKTEQQFQIAAVLWTVLQLPTQNPDRPGSVYNYAPDEETTVKLTVRDDAIRAELGGRWLHKD